MTAEKLLDLKERHSTLLQRRAALLALEEKKRQERVTIESELVAMGIDIKDPQAAIVKLQAEIDKYVADTTTAFDEFELKIKELEKD